MLSPSLIRRLLLSPESLRTYLASAVQNQQRHSHKKDHPHHQGHQGDDVLRSSGIQEEHQEERRHDDQAPYPEASLSEFRDHAVLRPASLAAILLLSGMRSSWPSSRAAT